MHFRNGSLSLSRRFPSNGAVCSQEGPLRSGRFPERRSRDEMDRNCYRKPAHMIDSFLHADVRTRAVASVRRECPAQEGRSAAQTQAKLRSATLQWRNRLRNCVAHGGGGAQKRAAAAQLRSQLRCARRRRHTEESSAAQLRSATLLFRKTSGARQHNCVRQRCSAGQRSAALGGAANQVQCAPQEATKGGALGGARLYAVQAKRRVLSGTSRRGTNVLRAGSEEVAARSTGECP